MNQIKIGNFIAEVRKQQNMTQRELAEKIGVSDKTISKWETGKSMPELGYLQQLCETLQINVNELLSGERLSGDDYPRKAEERCAVRIFEIIDMVKKASVKVRRLR